MRTSTPKQIGALIREARRDAGLSQTDLGERIGASRFWVAEFENGKPSVELGLALKALQALHLVLTIAHDTAPNPTENTNTGSSTKPYAVNLAAIIAEAAVAPYAATVPHTQEPISAMTHAKAPINARKRTQPKRSR